MFKVILIIAIIAVIMAVMHIRSVEKSHTLEKFNSQDIGIDIHDVR